MMDDVYEFTSKHLWIFTFIGLIIGIWFGHKIATEIFIHQAIQQGCGQYNQQTGQFEFKEWKK